MYIWLTKNRALNTVAIFTTKAERSIYIGLIALFWGLGCILGPIIGGAFADSAATWRWVCILPE